jgi:hypothetical protein
MFSPAFFVSATMIHQVCEDYGGDAGYIPTNASGYLAREGADVSVL